ncbi:UNVERIFIED_CONTAM: hypothetical protein GTU68_015167 [Idotea baltica]|nr:hypothetical protein [Idotea baltica]
MSVYTEVKRPELLKFLSDYALGDLISFEGISDGIENTNYFVTTEQGQFVLTLFEQHGFEMMDYFLDVMTFFFQNGIPSAHPEADKQGRYLKRLSGKPAALVGRLQGSGISNIASIEQCRAIGKVLGKMHVAGQRFPTRRLTERGADWRQNTAENVLSQLEVPLANLMKTELEFQSSYAELNLPSGLTHSDLFRDNALFDGDELKGIIDFYYACDEYLLYDLAVTVNDWCIDQSGLIETSRYEAMMLAYTQQRKLTAAETTHWNLVLRAAALRFWLSRLQDKFFPREGELTQIKNPDAFLKILQQHQAQTLIVNAA